MKSPLYLSRAEINGLVEYVRIFEKDVVPRMECVAMRHSLGDALACECVLKGRFKVTLERIWDDEWEGSCTCMERMDCIHCLGAAAHVLGMPPGLTAEESADKFIISAGPVSRAAMNSRDDIAALAAKALGRELSKEEQAYIGIIREAGQRMISRYALSVSDFTRLAMGPGVGSPLGHNPFESENIPFTMVCPSLPENYLDFYHGVARMLLVHGFRPAAFLVETLRQNPPPQSWIHEWDTRDEQAWRNATDPLFILSERTPRSPRSNGSSSLGMRIHLAPEGPEIEVRFSESEPWRVIKKTELGRVSKMVRDLELDAEPASAAIVHRVADWVLGMSKPEISYLASRYGPDDSAIAIFLRSPAIRACMLCPDRSPVPIVLPETQWRLVQIGRAHV